MKNFRLLLLRRKMRRISLRVARYELRVERTGLGFEARPEYAKHEAGPHRSDPVLASRNRKMRQRRIFLLHEFNKNRIGKIPSPASELQPAILKIYKTVYLKLFHRSSVFAHEISLIPVFKIRQPQPLIQP